MPESFHDKCISCASLHPSEGLVPKVALPAEKLETHGGGRLGYLWQSRGQSFVIEVTPLSLHSVNEPWEIQRRYSDFECLLDDLGLSEDSFPDAPFPRKHLFHTKSKMDVRRDELTKWLQRVLENAKGKPNYDIPLFEFLKHSRCACVFDAVATFPSWTNCDTFQATVAQIEKPPEQASSSGHWENGRSAKDAEHEHGVKFFKQHVLGIEGDSRKLRAGSVGFGVVSGLEDLGLPDEGKKARRRSMSFAISNTLEIIVEKEQAARRKNLHGFTDCARIIARDVPRTFAGQQQVDAIRMQLAEVLRSYAQKDPELGYTQGMSFAAAVLCVGKTPQEAELAFDFLMERLRKLWMPGFPMVMEGTPIFEQLMEERDPELMAHFESIRFNFAMVIPKAWLSLFAKWLHFSDLLEVVPFLGEEGIAGLVTLTLFFVICHRGFLLECRTFEAALSYLNNVNKEPAPKCLMEMCKLALPQFQGCMPGLRSGSQVSEDSATAAAASHNRGGERFYVPCQIDSEAIYSIEGLPKD